MKSDRNKKQNKQQFSPSDSSIHNEKCSPDSEEFSKLLKSMPEELLFKELSTQQQRQFAKALWEAANYGGKPKPGNFKDIEPKRNYLEWVLKIEHEKQWCKYLEKR